MIDLIFLIDLTGEREARSYKKICAQKIDITVYELLINVASYQNWAKIASKRCVLLLTLALHVFLWKNALLLTLLACRVFAALKI